MPDYYRIFDITVCSDFPLPELPKTEEQGYSLTVELGEGTPDDFATQGFKLAHEWRNPQGGVDCWCERRYDDGHGHGDGNGDYFYVFPGDASFHISSQGVIRCFLHEASNLQVLRHFLLNQIIPRYLASLGRLVLHAGALTLANGKSVAFLGNSGFGKSTLVSSFHRHGAELINDDCILLECPDFEGGSGGKNGVRAIGGLAGIRLFPDSLHAVFEGAAGFEPYMPSTDKQQLFLTEESGARVSPQRAGFSTLDAIFVLNDPIENPARTVAIEQTSGAAAMMAMVANTFSLDPSDKVMLARNFKQLGQVLAENLTFYDLRYPRVHDYLAELRAALIKQMEVSDSG